MILLPLNDRTDGVAERAGRRGRAYVAPKDSAASHSSRAPAADGDGRDRVVVDALAEQVDRHDRRDRAPSARSVAGRRRLEQGRAQVAGLLVAVDEVRLRADVADRVDGGGEGQGGDRHDVAGADAPRHQRQVQGGGARGEADRVRAPDALRDLGLEGREVGAGRGHPAGLHGADDVLLLELARRPGGTAGPCRGRSMTLQFPH